MLIAIVVANVIMAALKVVNYRITYGVLVIFILYSLIFPFGFLFYGIRMIIVLKRAGGDVTKMRVRVHVFLIINMFFQFAKFMVLSVLIFFVLFVFIVHVFIALLVGLDMYGYELMVMSEFFIYLHSMFGISPLVYLSVNIDLFKSFYCCCCNTREK